MYSEQVSSYLHNILEKALNGSSISVQEGYDLIQAPADSIPAICEVAGI